MHFSPFKIILLVAVFLFAALIYWQYSSNRQSFQEIPTYVANFKALNTSGEEVFFKEVKGKATLVVFTAFWCLGCRAELPVLWKIYEDYKARGLKVVMIDEDENLAVAQQYKEKSVIPWTMLFWNYDALKAFGNPQVIPANFLVDAEDRIVYVNVGVFGERELRDTLEELLIK